MDATHESVHVDFETLERRVRDSGRLMADVARSGEIPPVAPAPPGAGVVTGEGTDA